jgi:voltage-gated potassium channel
MSRSTSATAAEIRPEELGNPGYELFIVGLSIVSLVNFAIAFLPFQSDVKTIAQIVDIPISAILLVDFTRRLVQSHPRRAYFIDRLGWMDLLSSLPFSQVKIFRLFRVIRVTRLLRAYGVRKIFRSVMQYRADNALRIILFLVIVLLEFGSMSVLAAERSSPDANIKTGGEALWWGFVSITTVGYGDYTPVTTWGRTFATFMLAAGVGLFGALSGYLANFFLAPSKAAEEPAPPSQIGDPVRMLEELEVQFTTQLAAIRAAIASSASGPAAAGRTPALQPDLEQEADG